MAGEYRIFKSAASARRRWALGLALTMMTACAVVHAADAAEIQVAVTGKDGAQAPGILVSATHAPTGTNRWIITGDDGSGDLRGLDGGRWTLVVEGESTQVEQTVELANGDAVVQLPVALAAAQDVTPDEATAPVAKPVPPKRSRKWGASAPTAPRVAPRARTRRNWMIPQPVPGHSATLSGSGHVFTTYEGGMTYDGGVRFSDYGDEPWLVAFDDFWFWLLPCLATL